jgi:ADP-ribose pyrophosphatase
MTIKKWQTIAQETIFIHPRLTLVEDTVILPDGNKTKYLRHYQACDVATVIAIRNDGKILLEREYSHPPAEVLYQFPGGGVPLGEDIYIGANRELMEECGLRGSLELIGSYFSDNRRSDARTHVFIATDLQQESLPVDAEEFIECDWFTEDGIDTLILEGNCKHAYMLATWMLFKSWQSKALTN